MQYRINFKTCYYFFQDCLFIFLLCICTSVFLWYIENMTPIIIFLPFLIFFLPYFIPTFYLFYNHLRFFKSCTLQFDEETIRIIFKDGSEKIIRRSEITKVSEKRTYQSKAPWHPVSIWVLSGNSKTLTISSIIISRKDFYRNIKRHVDDTESNYVLIKNI